MADKHYYLLKLLKENIHLHNREVTYRIVLEAHGLLDEANKILHEILPDSYDVEGKEIS